MSIFDIFRSRIATQKQEQAATAERTIGEIIDAVLAGEYRTPEKADELLLILRQLNMPLERFETIVSKASEFRGLQAMIGDDAEFNAEMSASVDQVAGLRDEIDALKRRLETAKGELSGMQTQLSSRSISRAAYKEQLVVLESELRTMLAGDELAKQAKPKFNDNRSIFEKANDPLPAIRKPALSRY